MLFSPLQTSPPYTLQSTTDPVSIFRILYKPLQTQYESSVYSTIHQRPSNSLPYTLQPTTDQVLVLCVLYNPLQTWYKLFVFSTVSYRHSFSPSYTLLSTTDQVPPYSLQPFIDPIPVRCLIRSLHQTQCQSSLYSAVQSISSTSPP